MTDQSDPDFGDEPTQTDASAPLVDFGNTPAEMTAETAVTDMSTMPETRSAAQRTLAREVEEERRRRVVRDGSAPLRRSTAVRASAPEPIPCPDGIEGCEVLHFPPRRPEESRSLSSAPNDANTRQRSMTAGFDALYGKSGDMKAGLTSSRPKLTLMPARAELHTVRGLEYGADKYRRGNYHGAPPAIETRIATTPEEEALEREALAIMGYLDANLRHVREVTNVFQHAYGRGDLRGAIAALAAVDDVASADFPPSGLPHLGHGSASLSIAIERAVDAGFLPVDPGQPWRQGRVTEERSPEAATRHEIVQKPGVCECATRPAVRRIGDAECCAKCDRALPEHGTARPGSCQTYDPAMSGLRPNPDYKPAEELWHGYRRADVIAACDAHWGKCAGKSYSWSALGIVSPYDAQLVGWSDGTVELALRASGLRRPDEPDYKPLA